VNYKEYFKEKKIAVIGIGENASASRDVEFLAKNGATVTLFEPKDFANKKEVVDYFKFDIVNDEAAETFPKKKDWRRNVTLNFNKIDKARVLEHDLIIIDVSFERSHPILIEAEKKGIEIYLRETLFLKLAPPVLLIGITGTSGKTSVAYIINEIAKRHFKGVEPSFYFIDSFKGDGAISLLGKIKRDDCVLLEMSEEILDEMRKLKQSPHIGIITNIAKNYIGVKGSFEKYLDSIFTIFEHQTYNNFLVANDDVIDFIKASYGGTIKSKILRTGTTILPSEWEISSLSYHTKENIALAIRVAEILQIPIETVYEGVKSFKGLRGRLEYVKKINGVEYYNDGASKNIHSTLKSVSAIALNKNIILIIGGGRIHAEDQEFIDFIGNVSQYIHTLVLIPGTGTASFHRYILSNDTFRSVYAHSVYDAVLIAKDHAGKGDIVLFSPGFSHEGFHSEKERIDHFIWIIKGL